MLFFVMQHYVIARALMLVNKPNVLYNFRCLYRRL